MPRPTQGDVAERPWADGETISYGRLAEKLGRDFLLENILAGLAIGSLSDSLPVNPD